MGNEDMLVLSVEDKEYTVDMSVLSRQSLVPLGLWLDELMDPLSHGITQPEVDAFLAAVTGRSFHAVYSANYTRLEDWYAVLRLSTRWSFNVQRNRAIYCLETLVTPIEKLFLARAYDVPEWLVSAYTMLALRDEPLSEAEMRRLDTPDIALITSTREDILRQQLSNNEAAVASHFTRILNMSSATHAVRDPAPEASPVVVPSLLATDDDLAIVVSGPAPSSTSIIQQPLLDHEPLHPVVDISPFLSGRFDEGVQLITPESVNTIARALSFSPGFLSGMVGNRKVNAYTDRAMQVIFATLRRGVRDATFVYTGSRFVKAIVQASKKADCTSMLNGGLSSLGARFRDFARSPGNVPKQDKSKIMPTALDPYAYRTCMRNAQDFITTLVEQGLLRDVGWLRELCSLQPKDLPLRTVAQPLNEPIVEPVAPQTLPQLDDGFDDNMVVIVADDIPHENSAQSPVDSIVASLLAGDYDAGISRLSPDNAAAVWLALSEHASFQPDRPEPMQGERRTAPISQLARAILRRAFRDSSFVFAPTATNMLTTITKSAPWLGRDLTNTLHALLTRWKEFEDANGDCSSVRVDGGRYMSDDSPSTMEKHSYRERMERGKDVIAAIAKEGAFVGCETEVKRIAKRASVLSRRAAGTTN